MSGTSPRPTAHPCPSSPSRSCLRGQAPEGLWDALAALTASQGYAVSRGDCGAANGLTDVDRADGTDPRRRRRRPGRQDPRPRTRRTSACTPRRRPAGLPRTDRGGGRVRRLPRHRRPRLGLRRLHLPLRHRLGQSIGQVTPEDVVRATGQRVLTAAHWILGNHPDQHQPQTRWLAQAGAGGTRPGRHDDHRRPADRRPTAPRGRPPTSSQRATTSRSGQRHPTRTSSRRPSSAAAGSDRPSLPRSYSPCTGTLQPSTATNSPAPGCPPTSRAAASPQPSTTPGSSATPHAAGLPCSTT